jgi:hypothetical protein
MLRHVFPILKRRDVELTLECTSFLLLCAAFLHWVAVG